MCSLKRIKWVLEMLTVDKMNLVILSQDFANDGFCTKEEKWFKTRYCVQGRSFCNLCVSIRIGS